MRNDRKNRAPARGTLQELAETELQLAHAIRAMMRVLSAVEFASSRSTQQM